MARVDQRVIGAGTTLRFVLLLVLVLASSATMMSDGFVFRPLWPGDPHNDGLGCLLAAGLDPDASHLANNLAMVRNRTALDACVAKYTPATVPWWGPLAATAILLLVAGLYYWLLPAWKGRRSRVVPLDTVDSQGDLRPLLDELVATAGLVRPPRFVVNPTATSMSAVVFGRPRDHTVCLHGGLVARRSADPAGFRAVLLHELAHIRNGDVGITYATVALWRVFLIGVLLPYALNQGRLLFDGLVLGTNSAFWPGAEPMLARDFALSAFLVVLVYLARADILRTREVYADLDAVSWGADRRGWLHRANPGRFAAFTEIWRTHPRWDQRTRSLDDPEMLFGLSALPMFLTGAVAMIAVVQLPALLGVFSLASAWTDQLQVWVTAGFVTAIIGVALWRAVVHAVLTGRRVPTGWRAGLGLGFGLVCGELTLGRASGNHWLPARPEFLLLLVLFAVLVIRWSTQCAELWVRSWRGRDIRPVLLVGLAMTWLVFGVWFTWWTTEGYLFATGLRISDVDTRFDTPSSLETLAVVPGLVAVYQVLVWLATTPLLPAAATALWLAPLLAWTTRPALDTAPWVRKALSDVDDPAPPQEMRPPLRRILLGGLAGGVVGWAGFAMVMAYMHTQRPAAGNLSTQYGVNFLLWLRVPMIATSVVASVLVVLLARRYRMLVALIAAGIAQLAGLAGVFALGSFDGCLGPLNTFAYTCHWRPLAMAPVLTADLPSFLGLAVFAAAVAALLISTLPRLGRRRGRHSRPVTDDRRGLAVRRAGVAVICLAAVALVAVGMPGPPGDSSEAAAHITPAPSSSTASPRVRAMQVDAWTVYGGKALLTELANGVSAFANGVITLTKVPDFDAAVKRDSPEVAQLRTTCEGIEQTVGKAGTYFPIADPQAQSTWSAVLQQLNQGSADCQNALGRDDPALLQTSLGEFNKAGDTFSGLADWISAEVKNSR